jgi:carboxylesterase type B
VLGKELKCSGSKTLSCLANEKITPEDIKKVAESKGLFFSPIADNRTLISAPALRREMGAIAPIPVLIGSNSQEGRLFVQGQSDVRRYVQRTFGNNTAVVQAVLNAYPVERADVGSPFDAIAQIMTEYSFQCVRVQPLVNHSTILTSFFRTRLYGPTSPRQPVYRPGATT